MVKRINERWVTTRTRRHKTPALLVSLQVLLTRRVGREVRMKRFKGVIDNLPDKTLLLFVPCSQKGRFCPAPPCIFPTACTIPFLGYLSDVWVTLTLKGFIHKVSPIL